MPDASSQSIIVTVGTTNQRVALPPLSASLLLRCPSTNTADVFVKVGGSFAGTDSIRIRPGEKISLSIENRLIYKAIIGQTLTASDFFQVINHYSGTANQSLWIDTLNWQ